MCVRACVHADIWELLLSAQLAMNLLLLLKIKVLIGKKKRPQQSTNIDATNMHIMWQALYWRTKEVKMNETFTSIHNPLSLHIRHDLPSIISLVKLLLNKIWLKLFPTGL